MKWSEMKELKTPEYYAIKRELKKFRKDWGIHVCTSHTGKMRNVLSLSTSCTVNPFCLARMKDARTVCAHCYADAMQARYGNLRAALVKNSETLFNVLLPVTVFPFLHGLDIFRLESFGDIGSVIHARNYIRFCKRNPNTVFALWTKNPNLLETAYRLEGGKPENLVVNLSSEFTNHPREIKFFDVDRIFSVYDKAHVSTLNIVINCGAKACDTCRHCYQRGGVKIVNELLK